MVTPLILPAGEYAVTEMVASFLEDSGHLDCGGWTQDLADPDGTVTCSCGSQFVPVPADREAINYTVTSAGDGA